MAAALASSDESAKQVLIEALTKLLYRLEEYNKRTQTEEVKELTAEEVKASMDAEAAAQKEAEEKAAAAEAKAKTEEIKKGIEALVDRFKQNEWSLDDFNVDNLETSDLEALTATEAALMEKNAELTAAHNDKIELADDAILTQYAVGDTKPPNSLKKAGLDYQSSGEQASLGSKEPNEDYKFDRSAYGGSMSYSGSVVKEARRGKIEDGIEFLKSNPSDYMAMHFQTSMQNWPEDQQAYTLVRAFALHYTHSPECIMTTTCVYSTSAHQRPNLCHNCMVGRSPGSRANLRLSSPPLK